MFLLGPCNFNELGLLSVEQWIDIKVIKETAFEQLRVYEFFNERKLTLD